MSYDIPSRILRKLIRNAPTYAVSENSGRSGAYFGGYDECASSYKSICIYVQNGLGDYAEVFQSIAKSVFRIQAGSKRQYPLLVFGFGRSHNLQHEKKYFPLGFVNSAGNWHEIAETISRVSGITPCNLAIIPELYPKTDIRSLYHGKTNIDKDDLLIIIGRKSEVCFDVNLEPRMKPSLMKQILLVEIDNDEVVYSTNRDLSIRYLSLSADLH